MHSIINHLTDFEAFIANVSYYTTGTFPTAWQGVNVMIRKKLHDDLVTIVRTIVLTEADFNFNIMVLGQSVSQQAESIITFYHMNNMAQYGK